MLSQHSHNTCVSNISAHSCMRTGTEANQTAISCQVRTAWWWCGMTVAAGATFLVTISLHTPARKAQVSSSNSSLNVLMDWIFFIPVIERLMATHWIMSTIFMSTNSLLWAPAKSPKCLHIWKGSTEIWNKCSCSLSLCFGFPAETQSFGQVSVRRQLGDAKDPLH